MRTVFGDAGYWIALQHPDEKPYRVARTATARLGLVRILTSELVLAEYLDEMARHGPRFRRLAPAWISHLRRRSDVAIVPMTTILFDAALRFYASRPDKQWGFIDCSSFAIMAERAIPEALSHDRRFEQAGYIALPRNA